MHRASVPKEPIAPGASGEIEVKFNSKGKKNNQTKTVTINANTDPGQTILKIKAFVTPPKRSKRGFTRIEKGTLRGAFFVS